MEYMLHRYDVVRMQLSPDGQNFRYQYNTDNVWVDQGYNGPWVDATVVGTTYEPGELNGWPSEPLAAVEFKSPEGERCRTMLPLPGHYAFTEELMNLPGFPKPPQNTMPRCDCGSSAERNDTTHYHWCSYQRMLIAQNM